MKIMELEAITPLLLQTRLLSKGLSVRLWLAGLLLWAPIRLSALSILDLQTKRGGYDEWNSARKRLKPVGLIIVNGERRTPTKFGLLKIAIGQRKPVKTISEWR